MTSSSSSQSCNLDNKHIEHLSAELGGDDGLALALKYGATSLTTEQAKELNFKIYSPTTPINSKFKEPKKEMKHNVSISEKLSLFSNK